MIASATLEHLVELVADEDDRDALGRELAERVEQLVDLLRHEHGGWLVEDEDAGSPVEHLHDLDALAVADAELGDERVGLDREAVDPDRARRIRFSRRTEVEPDRRARLVSEHDVLGDGEVVGEHEVLMHHADAEGDRITRRLEALLLAAHADDALVGTLLAVEDLHQRRLPGAVLAHDCVDGTGRDGEVDAVVGDHSREPLHDASQLDGRELDRQRLPDAPEAPSGVATAPPCVLGHGTVLYYIRAIRPYGAVGTVMSPSMICCFRSSSSPTMSSRLPPVVE